MQGSLGRQRQWAENMARNTLGKSWQVWHARGRWCSCRAEFKARGEIVTRWQEEASWRTAAERSILAPTGRGAFIKTPSESVTASHSCCDCTRPFLPPCLCICRLLCPRCSFLGPHMSGSLCNTGLRSRCLLKGLSWQLSLKVRKF